jgi:SAM-dependent methyltransferase
LRFFAKNVDNKLDMEFALRWIPKNAAIGLDVGCGVNKLGGCIGVDIHNDVWYSVFNIKNAAYPDVISDIRYLPFRSNSVDFVFSCHSLEHFNTPYSILNEWTRVLKSGGRLIIIVPDYRYTYSCEQADQKKDPFGHKWDYTLNELCKQACINQSTEIIYASPVIPHFDVGVVLEKR